MVAPIPPSIPNRIDANRSGQAGFTLVELSIVLVIIGLIIGGVLKGQEMIQSARLKSTMNQVEAYRAAHNTFRDRYGALPGDFKDGQAALGDHVGITWTTPACDGSNAACDGDGVIEGSGASQESLLYWQHLAAADMITGIELGDTVVSAHGQGLPSAPVGGGFSIEWVTVAGKRAHWINLERAPSSTDGIIDGGEAESIDRKLDDGRPGTGWIRQTYTTCLDGGSALTTASQYNRTTGENCHLVFEIN
ncbi:MAG: prepilin-type N-terminal cleavage/methylation domain-containing protein [Geminicoccaceae bacterium]|nr:prepilin-type N-terminal cleavage/methylation domain-containing protein [Geminicoccaceae bacterium]MCB9945130.1 prepilin-type N-terminal cleavage/methylation domain-containing protein [Geminicoccaceae bacterium]